MYTLKITEPAQRVIVAIQEQAQQVMWAWTDLAPEYAIRTLESATKNLAQLMTLGFGDAEISRDGELSLYVSTGIQMGMIGFPIFRADTPDDTVPRTKHYSSEPTRMGTYCISQWHENPKPWLNKKASCECTEPTQWALPEPIEWSFHS